MGRPRKDQSSLNNHKQIKTNQIHSLQREPKMDQKNNIDTIKSINVEIKAEASPDHKFYYNHQESAKKSTFSGMQREKGDSMFDQTGLFEKNSEEWVFLRSLLDDNQATLFPSEENIEKFNKVVNPIQKKLIFKVNKGPQNNIKVQQQKEQEIMPTLPGRDAIFIQNCFNDGFVQQRFLSVQFEQQLVQDKNLSKSDFVVQWQPFENLISNVVYGIPVLVRKDTVPIKEKV